MRLMVDVLVDGHRTGEASSADLAALLDVLPRPSDPIAAKLAGHGDATELHLSRIEALLLQVDIRSLPLASAARERLAAAFQAPPD